jgi:PST family polysaccharide transporter
MISAFKDAITPALIGTLLGPAAVGHVNWALMVAAYPVLALMALQRVYLPSFARLQNDRAALAAFVGNVLRMTNALVAPLAVITLVLAARATPVVFGPAWVEALPLFYLFWFANLVVPTATPLVGLLNALGRSRVTFGFAVLWMAMTWVIGAPLVATMGALGFAVANLMVQGTGLWLFHVASRQIPLRVGAAIAPPWVVAAAMGVTLALVAPRLPATVWALGGAALAGLLLYGLGLALVWRGRLAQAFRVLSEGLRGG